MPGLEDDRSTAREAGRFLGAGIQFAASILLFLLAGQWLDGKLGTEPWLLLLGVFVGASAGFYSLYRQLMAGAEKSGRPNKGD